MKEDIYLKINNFGCDCLQCRSELNKILKNLETFLRKKRKEEKGNLNLNTWLHLK